MIDRNTARKAMRLMIDNGMSADAATAEVLSLMPTEDELHDLCRELIAANSKIVSDVQAGKLQAAGAFIGQAKKKNPNVNPARVREICMELILRQGIQREGVP